MFGLIDRAKKCFDQGFFDKALEIYKEALEINPNDTSILEEIGQIHYIMNDFSEALKINEELVQIYEKLDNFEAKAEIFKKIGRIYYLKENYSKALEAYDNSLQLQESEDISEETIGILFKLGELYYKLKRYSGALRIYKKLIHIHKKFGIMEGIIEDRVEIARIYKKQKNFSKALNHYAKALQILDQLNNSILKAIILYEMGKICYTLENYEDARDLLDESLLLFTRHDILNDDTEKNELLDRAKTLWVSANDILRRNKN